MQRIGVLLAIVFFVVIGCLGCSGGHMDREIQNSATEAINKYLIKCGDSYYYKNASMFEMRKIKLVVKEFDHTEADTLNGVEWSGKISYVNVGPMRINRNGKWDNWFMPNPNQDILPVTVKKIDGKWQMELAGEKSLEVISCDNIPK